jgi:DNA (cytosine-5)-methyltransferase 1
MKYLSICSGIESVGVAWHPLGFECLGLSEIDPFRSAVLNYHYPGVKNYGDFTQIERSDLRSTPDILVGGTPCATFSIAGLRKGMGEDRGNLALEFIRLAQRIKPKWILWENVPGILSSNEGKDLASFLGALAELGYGFAYRVLDAQYIRTQRYKRAVPQRRRRIFVVGCLGDWKSSAKVLFDGEALSGNSPPSREKKQKITKKSTHRIVRSDQYVQDEVASTIAARDYKSATDLVIDKEITIIHGNHTRVNGDGFKKDGATYTLTATEVPSVLCFEQRSADGGAPRIHKEEISPTLNVMTGGNRQPCVLVDKLKPRNSIIRRLTPLECERLQGFPDNYTQIPYRGKPKEEAPISKRYEACGRAMAINVMEWLGMRIQKVHKNEI